VKAPSLAAVALSLSAFAGCATLYPAAPPAVPERLRVEGGQALVLEARASGVQIYVCGPGKEDPASLQWVFKAPEADLFDLSGARIGKHYAGPTWESSDGSKVVGQVKAQEASPDPTAVPWLLLVAKSTSGTGVFGRIASIQRLDTVGGKAPAGGCDAAHAGAEARVPYRGTYFFYGSLP